MKKNQRIILGLLVICTLVSVAQITSKNPLFKGVFNADTLEIKKQPTIFDDDLVKDSVKARWKTQRTTPITEDDLNKKTADLKQPDNIEQKVEYNDTLNMYVIGSKIGDTYLNAPILMTPEEYRKWTEKQSMNNFFRSKGEEVVKNQGKEKFDFADMHFDLGPAEKIFGPGGVRIKTQGTAELKFGATLKSIDNPSIPIRNRNTTNMDFDEKINLNVNGKVGDKVNMNLNYNTDATFDFDAQNLKLKYDGKEDEIIKLVEVGNVSFPSISPLIRGASSLFGVRTDMQFGKLKLQTVFSQKKSASKSVSSKGGIQLTPFEFDASNYEENRHFFLSQYFRENYDNALKTLPNITTGININRVEVWVTNKTGVTTDTRNIVAFTDLGENKVIHNNFWSATGQVVPSNASNTQYSSLVSNYNEARDIDQTSNVLEAIPGFYGGTDYEKLSNARLLNSSEYTVNNALGYISLKTTLQTDQVLAVAYEYTYGGVTYQVGEFSSDNTETSKCLFVKSLKNTSNNPLQGNWKLMMKNVYYLASSVEKEKFRLDVKYQSDTSGVYLSYIPEQKVKDQPIIRLLGADRLDNNMKTNPNGYFDFVEGYTVSNGRVFIPSAEPFGEYMQKYLVAKGVSPDIANKYVFKELYDSTKTIAKQIAEKNKYILVGQYKGTSANVISLGAYNVPQGSVVVTAGGMTLMEGSDYSVDYASGEVTILNQSIIDAGTAVSVSLESNSDYAQQRKTMLGMNWQYDFSKNFQLAGTVQYLKEQSLTTKVAMGSEPLNNMLWGVSLNWKKESQWLTNMLDKIPFLNVTQPSNISFTADFAQLVAFQSSGTQDNASYLDDFENTKSTIDVSSPTSWTISSVPTMFPEHKDKTGLSSGFNRALLAWYNIDPLFTRRSSSLTPGHIKSDLEQLSNHYVREVYTNDLYPNRDQSAYNGGTATLQVLNLAYYPEERGPYNFNTNLNSNGTLKNPTANWGGMMRKLDTNDFEAANIEYVEFWMLDPFIYTSQQEDAAQYGGDLYINLGEVSEDILRDGKKFYESGMPIDENGKTSITQWGRVPEQPVATYAFTATAGVRAMQDVGYDGLDNEAERNFPNYQNYINSIAGIVSPEVLETIKKDPSNDDYQYFRGAELDRVQAPILDRYKHINNPQGNSPDNDSRTEGYDTSYKTTPDVEDINQDFTLNEYEKYYQYRIPINPEGLKVGENYIVDSRIDAGKLRNGQPYNVTWYQFRIPLSEYEKRIGNITDFTSIRFMRMFLTNFQKPIVLRFGSLDLVRGEWRVYNQQLTNSSSNSGTMVVSAVNIEENNDKTPVNYVLPPGIARNTDPTQPQLVESNEQALSLTVKSLGTGESKAVYKNTNLDIRQYKRLQMFVHANSLPQNTSNLKDNQLAVFVRFGSDYRNNYYEYEIPLKLTAEGFYDKYSTADREKVWPKENMLNIPLEIFTQLKKNRNKAKALGNANYSTIYTSYDENNPANKVSIVGNPSLGEVKTMIVGVRNLSGEVKDGEVWVNELRLQEFDNSGGWAAQAALNMQLSDFGSVNLTGKYSTEGFGGLEEGVAQRATSNYKAYSVTTNLELGKFFPEKANVSAPLYYSVSNEETAPKYNPLDTDMGLNDALEATANKRERDSIQSLAVTKTINRNFSLSNVRVGIQNKRHPMPYDPANFSLSYSHSHKHTSGETTVFENEDNWRGSLSYSWTPVYTAFEPFKGIKSRSKWFDIFKRFSINWLPQNISFNTEITRNYYELQERDMENLGSSNSLPLTFNEQFLWNRDFSFRWDLTKNIRFSFQSATHAEIEEPYTPINKSLYPDRYTAWKDSVMTSIRNLGTPLDYAQSVTASYQLPLNLIPIFNWINADASYNATYNWVRGTALEDGTSLGNTVTSNRTFNINTTLNLQRLYDQVPFLRKTNERFNKASNNGLKKNDNLRRQAINGDNKDGGDKNRDRTKLDRELSKNRNRDRDRLNKELPKNKNSFEREITIKPDTFTVVNHGKKTKRFTISMRNENGKSVALKYKKSGLDEVRIYNTTDSVIKVKVTITPKQPLDELTWYKTAQCAARVLMMVRNVNGSYRNQYSMTLPGFMPTVGDVFGQRRGSELSPGLDFAFGFIDNSFIDKAKQNNWLLNNDAVATPAITNKTEDLQLKATIEPIKDFKIDLNASRMQTVSNTIQYMYKGNPSNQTGTFTITTLSLRSALEGSGNANNGFYSKSFIEFCSSLDHYKTLVESKYAGSKYPVGTTMENQTYNPEVTPVNKYSADVMIPAFLSTYTLGAGNSLDIFPAITRMLPNWTLRYSGLSQLPFFADIFKSVNINHSYKSVYAVGSYSTFSTWQEYMNGFGFVNDAISGNPIPSSMFNVSAVSINESFSPLLGIDVTLQNNMTWRLEYRTTRVLNLSMTSVQLTEATSNDWVIGGAYKINDFKLFGKAKSRKIKSTANKKNDNKEQTSNQSKPTKGEINHALNLRLDLSLRKQATIVRDILTQTSSASTGNTAFKLSFSAEYTLSKLLTMSFYYDRQSNSPLLTNNGYPMVTQDFGLSFKFSLTR